MEFPDNRTALRALPRRHREAVGEIAASRRMGYASGAAALLRATA